MDWTILAYEITKYVLLYNFFLFLWWMVMVKREGGHTSTVYLIVMCLFLARLYGVLMGIRARHLLEYSDVQPYIDFMGSALWVGRIIPEAIVFAWLSVVLTKRFIKSYLYHDSTYSEIHGRRKDDKK